MARTNGPIQVWHRTDTIPTDGEGGYAGGDSTAAAVGTALAAGAQASAQASAAIQLAMAAQTVNRDSPTGRLYYAVVTPPIMADDFNRGDESPVSPTPIGGKALLPGPSTTLSVTGNQLAMHGSITRTGFWDAGQADGVYRITVADTGWNGTNHAFGVLFRASGPDWSSSLILRGEQPAGSNYAIQARSGGAYGSYLSGVATHPASNGDQVEVTMSGPQITIRVNGNVIYDAIPPGSWTGTHVGVFNPANRDAVRFDNVSFEQIGA